MKVAARTKSTGAIIIPRIHASACQGKRKSRSFQNKKYAKSVTERTCHARARRQVAIGRIQVQYHGCSTGLRISATPSAQSIPRFQFRMKRSETKTTHATRMTL